MFERRQVKTRGQLMRDELSEGVDHLWQAASHAAGEVGAAVGPRWDSAKERLPWIVRMREQEVARSRRRRTFLFGLLGAGAVLGALGALLARRRNRSRWQEYESRDIGAPEPEVSAPSETPNIFAEQAPPTASKNTRG